MYHNQHGRTSPASFPEFRKSCFYLPLFGYTDATVFLSEDNPVTASNPLLTPAHTPDFNAIRPGHYLPALEAGLTQAMAALEAIKADSSPATFDNTVLPLERLFRNAHYVLGLLSNATLNTYTTELAAIEEQASLRYAEVSKTVFQDPVLGARFQSVYNARNALNLDTDDSQLLARLHQSFEAQGGLLQNPADQKKIRELDAALISLAQKFTANLQAAPLQQAVLVTDPAELAGLTPAEIENLAADAKKHGHAAGWLFIPERLLVDELLERAENSAFRRKIHEALDRMGKVAPHDNRGIIMDMQKNRDAYAKLLGYKNYSNFARSRAMVNDLAAVEKLLADMAAKALPKFEADMKALETFAAQNGGPARLEPWDVPYWVTRQRAALYNFDANAFTQHLEIENVVAGMFAQAEHLFDVTFAEDTSHSVLHPDIRVYNVTDKKTGTLAGILHVDMYARPGSKSGGAWMNSIQPQENGRPVTVILNMNIAKPPAGQPALIGLSQYITLYHEMGHCMQGLLGMDVKHVSLQGTSGPADFVEIHSMINERRALLRDNLQKFALHATTQLPAPDAVIDALLQSQSFFETRELLKMVQNSLRDLALHAADPMAGLDDAAIEAQVRFKSPYADHMRPYPLARFSHLFSDAHSGYAAGYVNYLLAEVHAADGFTPFKDAAYDRAWADKLKTFYRRGGGTAPLELYRQYRGADATPDAMLRDMGILPEAPAPKHTPPRP